MKKIVKVKDQDIDGRTPHMSISHALYVKGLEKLREEAKSKKLRLITNDGIEDYREK